MSLFSVMPAQREWVFGYQTRLTVFTVLLPQGLLIYYIEALCVLAALSHCCPSLSPNQKLLLYTDNTNVVDIFSSLCCHPKFNTIIKHTITTRVKSKINLQVLHIPGEMNSVADAISRADFNCAKILAAKLSVPNLSILEFPHPLPTTTNPSQPPRTSLGATQK
jgi:hypothetical protein